MPKGWSPPPGILFQHKVPPFDWLRGKVRKSRRKDGAWYTSQVTRGREFFWKGEPTQSEDDAHEALQARIRELRDDEKQSSIHHLKTWPEEYSATLRGDKRFEFRYNDRDYRVGDTLVLEEWNPETEEFTGRELRAVVTYLLEGDFGVPVGYCVMSVGRMVVGK